MKNKNIDFFIKNIKIYLKNAKRFQMNRDDLEKIN